LYKINHTFNVDEIDYSCLKKMTLALKVVKSDINVTSVGLSDAKLVH